MVALPFCNLRLQASRAPDFPICYARHPQTLGEHIRKERLYRGLRQRDLGQLIGVNEMTVAGWEKDRERPLARHYGAIVRFLGFDPLPGGDNPADRLRAARRRLGLTQAMLAKQLGLDEGTVTEFELRRRKASAKVIRVIGDFLDRQA